MKAPEERFSDRVDAYVKHRPSYPAGVIETLGRECGLAPGSVVADIGSGTGIFSALLLDAGWRVIGVEPNAAMGAAAEKRFVGRTEFRSVAGSAERTGLTEESVDLVVAAQAFHWFRPEETRREFARILRPGGAVALVWNHRCTVTAFEREYERLLREFAPEYAPSQHRDFDTGVQAFFEGAGTGAEVRRWVFPSEQRLDWAGLRGRLESSSYAPKAGEPGYEAMMRGLEAAFGACAEKAGSEASRGASVKFGYETRLYLGRL